MTFSQAMDPLMSGFSVLFLLLTFFSHLGAAYHIDTSCANYQAMIDAALTESIYMIVQAGSTIGNEVWTAEDQGFGDVTGLLFPTGLNNNQKTAIQGRDQTEFMLFIDML